MSRSHLRVIPLVMSALAIASSPGEARAERGVVLRAVSHDCWYKWTTDASGIIECKETGTNCHAPCPKDS